MVRQVGEKAEAAEGLAQHGPLCVQSRQLPPNLIGRQSTNNSINPPIVRPIKSSATNNPNHPPMIHRRVFDCTCKTNQPPLVRHHQPIKAVIVQKQCMQREVVRTLRFISVSCFCFAVLSALTVALNGFVLDGVLRRFQLVFFISFARFFFRIIRMAVYLSCFSLSRVSRLTVFMRRCVIGRFSRNGFTTKVHCWWFHVQA